MDQMPPLSQPVEIRPDDQAQARRMRDEALARLGSRAVPVVTAEELLAAQQAAQDPERTATLKVSSDTARRIARETIARCAATVRKALP